MMATALRLRTLTESDVAACADLIERTALFAPYGYGRKEASADLTAELTLARPTSTMLVAEAEGSLVGFCRFLIKGAFDRCGYLRLIVVDPAHTSGGVGRALMEALERQHLSPHGIMLLCTDDNESAQRFYRRLGYEQVGLIQNYVKAGLHERIYFKAGMRPGN